MASYPRPTNLRNINFISLETLDFSRPATIQDVITEV
jgi:hypothetical protein